MEERASCHAATASSVVVAPIIGLAASGLDHAVDAGQCRNSVSGMGLSQLCVPAIMMGTW
jgi:hypothetical protein